MVVVEQGTAIEAITITLCATITFTIINVCKLKTMPCMHILKFSQLLIIVKVVLKGSTS